MESDAILEINISDDLETVDDFIIQVLSKCCCSMYAKYFKGISKDSFLKMNLRDIDSRIPGFVSANSVIISVAAWKINEELTHNNALTQFASQENQMIDPSHSFAPTSLPHSNNYSQSNVIQEHYTPKRKIVGHDAEVSSDESEENNDEPQRKRICLNDEDINVVVKNHSENILQSDLGIANVEINEPQDSFIHVNSIQPSSCSAGIEIAVDISGRKLHSIEIDDQVHQTSIVEEGNDEVLFVSAETDLHRFKPSDVDPIVLSDDTDDESEKENQEQIITAEQAAPKLISSSSNPIAREWLIQQQRIALNKTDTDMFVLMNEPATYIANQRSADDYAKYLYSKISLVQKESVENNQDASLELSRKELLGFKEWTRFYKKYGKTITSVKLNVWSWDYLYSRCPFNLNKLLQKNCPNIKELIFNAGPKQIHSEFGNLMRVGYSPLFRISNLPALRKIVVHAETEKEGSKKIPTILLQNILHVACNLEEFWYEFRNVSDATAIVTTLGSFNADRLKKLTTLRISYKENGCCLECYAIKLINSIQAKNLQELILDFHIWDDGEEQIIEQLFQNFPLLKKFIMYGSYQAEDYVTDADIAINIPAMVHLEHLEINSHEDFQSFIKDRYSRDYFNPARYGEDNPLSQSSSLESIFDPRQGLFQQNVQLNQVQVEKRLKGEKFQVHLSIPHLLPKLKTIILDEFVGIDELHFSSIPKISTFCVGSDWHLSTKFPSENSRRNYLPCLAELQIPNCFKDESFLMTVPKKFPNITKCWIYLPTVKVLRSFFKTMANSKLNSLILCTQFYFESTLEICLFAEQEAKMTAVQMEKDKEKWEELQKYPLLKDFLVDNDVEVPCWEILDELTNDDNYAGLSALQNLKLLEIKHARNRLRIPIPDGDKQRVMQRAAYSDNSIGFRSYPLSKGLIEQLPSWVKYSEWTNFELKEGAPSTTDV